MMTEYHNQDDLENPKSTYRIGVLYQGPAVQISAQYDAFSKLEKYRFHFLYINEKQRNPAWKPSFPKYVEYTYLPAPRKFWPPNVRYHLNANIFPILNKYDFDALILHSIYDSSAAWQSVSWCKKNKKPYLLRSDANIRHETGFIKRRLMKPLIGRNINGASAYLCIGQRNREFFTYHGANPEKFFNAPWEIDYDALEQYSQSAIIEKDITRRELGIHKEECAFVIVARLLECKGFRLLIPAIAALANQGLKVKLVIVGEGPYKNTIIDLIKKYKAPVHLCGNLDREGVARTLSVSDVFVLSSYYEPWGLVVNEAALCGLPLILSDVVGASADLLQEDVNGYIFKSGNLDSLIQVMKSLALNQALRIKMGTMSQEIIKKWRNENSAIDGYREALDSVFGIAE